MTMNTVIRSALNALAAVTAVADPFRLGSDSGSRERRLYRPRPSRRRCVVNVDLAIRFSVGAVVCAWISLPRPAFACGGECATVDGGTAVTLLAIGAGAWALIRCGSYLRLRVIGRGLRRLSQ